MYTEYGPAMTLTRGWRRLLAGACAAGLFLAGCGGDTDADSAEDRDYQGPLAEFFGWDDQPRDSSEASEQERQRHYEVQDYIVTCMAEAGFEYQPEPFWADMQDARDWVDPFEEVWKLREEDPEAFAREYGYGLTTIDYSAVENGRSEPTPGPNEEYRESLSPAAQEEYDRALWGDWVETTESNGDVVVESAEGGCNQEAYEAVYGTRDDRSQFEALYEDWDQLYQRIENDPRLTEAVRAWSDCMADAGYPGLEDMYGGENLVYERQAEAYGWDTGDGRSGIEPMEPVEADPDEADLEGTPAPAPPTPVELDPEVKAELREFELAVAWADYECREEHDVERIQREVQYAHEEQFIEDHRAELEAYRDWLNELEGAA